MLGMACLISHGPMDMEDNTHQWHYERKAAITDREREYIEHEPPAAPVITVSHGAPPAASPPSWGAAPEGEANAASASRQAAPSTPVQETHIVGKENLRNGEIASSLSKSNPSLPRSKKALSPAEREWAINRMDEAIKNSDAAVASTTMSAEVARAALKEKEDVHDPNPKG